MRIFSILLVMMTIAGQSLVQGQTNVLPNGIYAYSKMEESFNYIIVNKVVMQIADNQVRGYYGWAAQGESSFYFEGQVIGNEIKGDMYSLVDKQKSPFVFKIKNKTLNLTSPSGPVVLNTLEDELIETFNQYNIYAQPDMSATIIQRNAPIKDQKFKIIEIGKMGPSGDSYLPFNVWYKIKNEHTEGWTLGILSAL